MLEWPEEITASVGSSSAWRHPGTNLCLDFHGDPLKAKLVVFSDGNHHMALLETLALFQEQYSGLKDIFYATTPPGPILKLLKEGRLQIGNLVLSIVPHVFLSPPHVLADLVAGGFVKEHVPFVKNKGSVLVVKKGNPKKIRSISDLDREDVRIFISNPQTEKVSYDGYMATLLRVGREQGVNLEFLSRNDRSSVVYGEKIHHREAPQAIADNRADVAIVYYHLALRYTRIFPSLFEMVALSGSPEHSEPSAANVIGLTHVGLVGDGGDWGERFLHFLSSSVVSGIYRKHGLCKIS